MGHSPSRPPLKPETDPEPPPWRGQSIFEPKYKGRKYWWTELGYEDPVYNMGFWRDIRPEFRESDEWWFDPKVPDGTSLPGPNGNDSKYHRNVTIKLDAPGNFYDYHKKITENSRQFKNIASKYDISPEHPGVNVSPTLSSLDWTSRLFVPNLWYLGPRFWDKPINEGCFTKGLAGAKLGALSTLPFAIGSLFTYPVASHPTKQNLVLFGKRYASMAWYPAVLGFAYASSVCAAANIRDKDDTWNWTIAAAAMGFTTATIRDSVTKGSVIFILAAGLGYIYHTMRCDYKGLQGGQQRDFYGFLNPGPFGWNLANFGEAKAPNEKW